MTDAFVVFRQALQANLKGILGPLVPPETDLDRRTRASRAQAADDGPQGPHLRWQEPSIPRQDSGAPAPKA